MAHSKAVHSAASARVSLSSRFQEFVCADWLSCTYGDQHLIAYSPYEDISVLKGHFVCYVCECVLTQLPPLSSRCE